MEKNNKLIAEFMGVGKHYEAQSSNMFNQYHTDWNKLMLVIEKIADLYIENPQLDYQSYDNIRFCVPNLQDTYEEVVQFIKDYNNGEN